MKNNHRNIRKGSKVEYKGQLWTVAYVKKLNVTDREVSLRQGEIDGPSKRCLALLVNGKLGPM